MSLRTYGPFFLCSLALLALGLLIVWSPVLVATLSVAFFAGPHNFFEAKYLLGRLPGRAGKLKSYFVVSAIGVGLLGLTSLVLPFLSSVTAERCWNTALILWVAGLAVLRRAEHPRREWLWVEPLALFLAGTMWAYPFGFTMVLVLGHPLLALFILGRELHAFRRPERRFYPQVLAAVALGLGVVVSGLYVRGWLGPSTVTSFFVLPTDTPLFLATHTYLELIHYAVWIGALPLLASATKRNKLSLYPVLRKSAQRLAAARIVLVLGLLVAGLLWWGFSHDFETTRDLYFRLAIFHVLIEFPFLLRLV